MHRDEAARIRALLEHASDVVVETDAARRVLWVSPNAAKRWGVDPASLIGRDALDGVHPEDRSAVHERFRAGRESGVGMGLFRSAGPNGQIRWYEGNARRYATEGGDERIVLVIRDVTQRKRIEDGLRIAAAMDTQTESPLDLLTRLTDGLRQALDVDFAFVAEVDDRLRIARTLAFRGPEGDLPPHTYSLAGTPCEAVYSGELCIYRTGVQAQFPDDADLVHMNVDAYAGVALAQPDSTPMGLISGMHTGALPDPEVARALLPAFGMRVANELERLRADAERAALAGAIDGVSEGVLVTDVHNVVHYRNPAWTRIAGRDASPEVGASIAPSKVSERAAELGRSLRGEVLEAGSWRGRMRGRGADPPWLDVSVHRAPGGPDGSGLFVTILRDVTREVRIEASLQERHKLEALGTLAGGVAHDFNNLLTAILGYAGLLRETLTDPESRDAAEVIEQAATRAADLTEQLLSFSGRTSAEGEPVDLNALVTEVVRLLRRTFPRSIAIETALADGEVWTVGEASQLHRALLNLAVNARDALPEGGRLRISTDAAGDSVGIQVADDGPGIPEPVRRRVFEPFFTTKAAGEGAGMGLALVFGVARSHGGSVEIGSEGPWGTVVSLRFPRSEPGNPPALAPESRGAPEPRHVLVVDDEASVRRVLTAMCESMGYRAENVPDAESALARVRSRPDAFDLVILDLDMPGIGGLACIEHLFKAAPHLQVLVATGLPDADARDRATKAGARRVLGKPLRVEELRDALRELSS